jgi:uncharacterized Zn-binding protein involved in type VI secretion
MEITGWIRVGDGTSCGGTVEEGSIFDTCDGRPYSFQGAKIACASRCVIAEGYPASTLSNGKPQALHDQVTSGGCRLISSSQDVDGLLGDAEG